MGIVRGRSAHVDAAPILRESYIAFESASEPTAIERGSSHKEFDKSRAARGIVTLMLP
jgi:hypothetical protein